MSVKMTYNGVEVESIDTPQIFDSPKRMVVWSYRGGEPCDVCEREVVAILPQLPNHANVVCLNGESLWWASYCAEIPVAPKPKRATNRELAKWLAQGNGEWICESDVIVKPRIDWFYDSGYENLALQSQMKVRKWDDTEWHEPTVDYMGIEG